MLLHAARHAVHAAVFRYYLFIFDVALLLKFSSFSEKRILCIIQYLTVLSTECRFIPPSVQARQPDKLSSSDMVAIPLTLQIGFFSLRL